MWTLTSALSSQFQVAGRQLYAETRRLLHSLESEEPHHQISIEQAQAWTLLATYELMCEDYHRGMMSAGRAFRLIQMTRLYELDVPQSPPTTHLQLRDQRQLGPQLQDQDDWVDVEMKRRTFWLAYTLDRFTSMVDGLHLFFDERMVRLSRVILWWPNVLTFPPADSHPSAGSRSKLCERSAHGNKIYFRPDSGCRPRVAGKRFVVIHRNHHRGDHLWTSPGTQAKIPGNDLQCHRYHF